MGAQLRCRGVVDVDAGAVKHWLRNAIVVGKTSSQTELVRGLKPGDGGPSTFHRRVTSELRCFCFGLFPLRRRRHEKDQFAFRSAGRAKSGRAGRCRARNRPAKAGPSSAKSG